MPKRAAAPFGARTGTDGRCGGPRAGRAINRAPIACTSGRDHASGTQPAVCNPQPGRMPCPSPRHLPILAAGRALAAGGAPGFQPAGVYVITPTRCAAAGSWRRLNSLAQRSRARRSVCRHEHVQPENPRRRGLSGGPADPPAASLGRPYRAHRRRLRGSPPRARKRHHRVGRGPGDRDLGRRSRRPLRRNPKTDGDRDHGDPAPCHRRPRRHRDRAIARPHGPCPARLPYAKAAIDVALHDAIGKSTASRSINCSAARSATARPSPTASGSWRPTPPRARRRR